MRWLIVTAFLLSSTSLFAADPRQDALVKTAKSLFAELRTETLPNGLRVYLLPVPSSPVVSTMMAYKVGACDENKDQTGLSHYLEHLLFKGTDKLFPGDIDRATQRNGGANNAYTSEDLTVYHFDFAADRWKIALEIEADRMRGTRIDARHEFEQEKGAVIAELKGGEDRPWELEYKAILPRLYPKEAPYSHPVIGEESHVRGATAEIIKRYYDQWYHPNNASLVIVGGIDVDETLALVKKLFGPIPRGELPPRKVQPNTPPRTEQLRHEFVSKFDVPRALIGWNTVPAGHPDELPLMLLGQVLTSGKTSRLYKRLVEGERLASDVGAGPNGGRYPGWFAVNLEMLPGKDRARAEAILFEELDNLAIQPVPAAELQRHQQAILASYIFGNESVHSLADLIAQTVSLHDVNYLTTYLDRVLAVTPADLQRVAKQYLRKNQSVLVWSLPATDGGAGGKPAAKPQDRPLRQQLKQRIDRLDPASPGGARSASRGLDLTKTQRVTLPNGLKLLLLENRRLPILVAEAYVHNIRLLEPEQQSGLASFVGSLLSEGTTTRSGEAIAEAIENVGGSLQLGANGGSLKVLTPDTTLGLSLLLDCLQNPSFPAEAVERIREQQLSQISETETQPNSRAAMLFNAAVYGSHPFARSAAGRTDVVRKLTGQDAAAFHARAFVPNNITLVIVGDFDTAAMVKQVEQLTKNWKPREVVVPPVPAPPVPEKPEERIVSDPTAAQTHVFIGHLGIKRDDPDYYALLVMDNILGTGPGFTDRLSANLRDRQGLAYTVRAEICSSAADQPGLFRGYIGTFPDKYRIAREGFLAEIRKIREQAPSEQEVADAKAYILGSLPFKLITNEGVAAQLLAAERFSLGFNFLNEYREKIQTVTPATVQAVAQKHLVPNRLKIITVGPIDAQGLPLNPPKAKGP